MDFSLLSSTRYDPFLENLRWNNSPDGGSCPFLLLSYHLDRLLDATIRHGWQRAAEALNWERLYDECSKAVQNAGQHDSALKIRIVLDFNGGLTAVASPVRPFISDPTSPSFFIPDTDSQSRFSPVFTIHLDTEATPSSIFTSTKTTNRAHYDNARTRAGVPTLASLSSPLTTSYITPSDVVLYNSQGVITETTISNIAFWRSKRWVTPRTSSGCLPGVLRRWLLEQGRIREVDSDDLLTKDTIKNGDWVLLFNGVQGCRIGRIMCRNETQRNRAKDN